MTRQRPWGTVIWAVAAFCLTVPAPAGAADLKIGFIDSERIFAEYAGTQEAQKSFNREVQELTKTAKEKKTEIDDLQRKLDAQGPMLSEAKRDEQNQILQKKIAEYDAFVQKNWGPQGSVSKLNEQYLKPIVDRVHRIVSAIGSGENYSIIMDAADGNIIFGDKTLDLTDRVLDQLRKEDSSGVPTPSNTAPAASGGSQ
ncbi:MAG: OmpH family outer membrane protein [Candidatus Eisenbacteria bacterium]|uniref:OmpH family outer membrane protein n=1 Tax=Eiseniibacteriota bacterium TaxID=2212470 RepID=A0A538T9S3_UNCEI|nr:MAG: OmpH family outer membrane protein [Candidatus Eisenbacteria bacterium]